MSQFITVLVGPRYRLQDVRSGARDTVVLETNRGEINPDRSAPRPTIIEIPKPVSGPIVRMPNNGPVGKSGWHARCEQCGERSKPYTRKNEPAMSGWAFNHRCEVKV